MNLTLSHLLQLLKCLNLFLTCYFCFLFPILCFSSLLERKVGFVLVLFFPFWFFLLIVHSVHSTSMCTEISLNIFTHILSLILAILKLIRIYIPLPQDKSCSTLLLSSIPQTPNSFVNIYDFSSRLLFLSNQHLLGFNVSLVLCSPLFLVFHFLD